MSETVLFLKSHLADHFAVYFILLYTFGGRPVAILAALAVDISVYCLIPFVVALDTFQIPVFSYLYQTVSNQGAVRKWSQRSKKRIAWLQRSALAQRLAVLGPPGVVAITMLPLKGCGMWSGVLLSRLLKIPMLKSYSLLVLGSFLGCLLVAGAGEAIFQLIASWAR
ncbi:MAG: small multi-drug export protein [Desulfobacteraceae bacterium]|jgi:uncharacterized membrane protein